MVDLLGYSGIETPARIAHLTQGTLMEPVERIASGATADILW